MCLFYIRFSPSGQYGKACTNECSPLLHALPSILAPIRLKNLLKKREKPRVWDSKFCGYGHIPCMILNWLFLIETTFMRKGPSNVTWNLPTPFASAGSARFAQSDSIRWEWDFGPSFVAVENLLAMIWSKCFLQLDSSRPAFAVINDLLLVIKVGANSWRKKMNQ